MTTVKFTPHNEDQNEYEFRSPIIFSRDGNDKRQVQFQAPIHKVDDSTEFKLQSPFKSEKDDDSNDKHVTIQSPIEKKDDDSSTKVTMSKLR